MYFYLSKNSWTKFRNDPLYLTKYFGTHTFILLLGCILGFIFYNHDSHLNFQAAHFLLLPLAVFFGIKIPTLMHNCVHGNLKSPLLNFLIGELTCFFVLMGMGIITINHTLHHAYSDSDLDPHNPSGKSFFQFFYSSLFTGVQIIENKFYEFHSKSKKNILLFKMSICMHYFDIFLRLILWYLILGPTLFVAFFIPAFISYVFVFAHVNYKTHFQNELGEIEIVNLDNNLYYKIVNMIGSGVYYHKNHHTNPKCYNPKYLHESRNSIFYSLNIFTKRNL